MKKSRLLLMLAMMFLVTGCANKDEKVTQLSPTTEDSIVKEDESSATENENQENSVTDQNEVPSYESDEQLETYMNSVKEQSDDIKDYLEYEAMTQADMNMKSQELYELWDGALNYLWGELKANLPEEEFAKLQEEQRSWITEKENAMEEAGKEVEGGSLYPLVVNSEAARITEERVYEFYEFLQKGSTN